MEAGVEQLLQSGIPAHVPVPMTLRKCLPSGVVPYFLQFSPWVAPFPSVLQIGFT